MITVESFFNQVTDPQQILASIKKLLAAINPQFAIEEQKYKQAAKILLESVGSIHPSAEEYLAALEERYGYELLYIGWQGFQYNLDCFNAPVNAMMLNGDFEDLHRERRLHTLTSTQQANLTINAFHTVLKENSLLDLTDAISSFYTTIETEGYKVAHYFGFLFADRFLPLVVPGYTPDSVLTNTYSMLLSRATGFNLYALESAFHQGLSRRTDNAE